MLSMILYGAYDSLQLDADGTGSAKHPITANGEIKKRKRRSQLRADARDGRSMRQRCSSSLASQCSGPDQTERKESWGLVEVILLAAPRTGPGHREIPLPSHTRRSDYFTTGMWIEPELLM